ncbi:MAG: electron transfer flavoprotein subunit beta/FixA family protein [Candidatus Kapabacteria bacterium]|nr:electron transfer flavoprotein subunit beta/FixA family protein [Candidatus Kapabacteria bacterium]
MNILVCVSRVPDTTTRILVGPDGKTADKTGVKFVLNPFDEFALEEGLRLREKNGGSVTAVTVAGEVAKDILRTSLAMGADKVAIIKTENEFDSYFTAQNLAEFASNRAFDIILLGKQSIDYDSLQIPAYLGELLGIPSIGVVSKLQIEGNNVSAERDIEGGKEIVSAQLPCIISAQKGLNEPRYPKLPDIMKAKSKPIEEVAAIDCQPRTTILEMSIPSKKRAGVILDGSDGSLDKLVTLLHEEAKVI